MTIQPTRSTSSPPLVLGRVEPRLWTPPLRDLSRPEASWGYDFIDFCELIGHPLDPWERWLAIHLGELYPDGSPRYRKAIILVARQNGKTVFSRLLILYWMFVERVGEIVATNTDRGAAKRSWRKVVELAENSPLLAAALARRHTVLQIGEEDFFNTYGSHYRFAAPNRRAGRGDTLNRALLDELREHRTRDTWDAIVPTMNAVDDALLVCISNEGGTDAVVLHEEYDAARDFIDTGIGDPRTFLAAWSCPPGSNPTDLQALAYANPNLGHRIPPDALLGQALAAVRAGGETLARFRIEIMCERVDQLNAAIDPDRWKAAGTDKPHPLEGHRRSVALCFDVALDGSHCTLVAAAVIGRRVHLEVVKRWHGFGATAALRAELPGLVAKIRPRKIGWYPGGPAASVAAALAEKRGQWPPRRVDVEELGADIVPAACMGLAEQVNSGQIRHPRDAMLDAHVAQTQRLDRGDRWVFVRRGSAPIDGTYAAAGAVHLARTLPPPPPPLAVA
jgi:hypothetical protein